MRVVIQRVKKASVSIENKIVSSIENGLLVLAGIEELDNEDDINWLSSKICNLRIFSDNEGKMNLSIKEVSGDLLVVSQFTLFANTQKGNRPSFIKSAKPDVAIPIYKSFLEKLHVHLNKPLFSGKFGADMQIELINDGPVTIIIDSKNRE